MKDKNIELASGWASHAGGTIGGVAPSNYGYLQNYANGWMKFFTYSLPTKVCADWEAYILRPAMPGAQNFVLDFDLIVDENSEIAAQCLEFDTIFCDPDGFNYNGSLQNNYAEGGMIQIAKADGSWIDTGFKIGKFSPVSSHHISIYYFFDIAKKQSSIWRIVIDGSGFDVPIALQKIAATKANWKPGLLLQIQQDLIVAGGSFQTGLKNIQYTQS